MTTPNSSATAQAQNSTNNPSNKETLSKAKTALADSISLIELMQSTSLIMPRSQSLQLGYLELQDVSVTTNDLINKLELARNLINEDPNAIEKLIQGGYFAENSLH